MLGLGDIVIPGFFIAMILRYDAMRSLQKAARDSFSTNSLFAEGTFLATMVSYVLGLGMTLFVMFYFSAAQPALLYLVPACLSGSMLSALAGGHAKALLAYSEEEEEEAKEKAAKKDD